MSHYCVQRSSCTEQLKHLAVQKNNNNNNKKKYAKIYLNKTKQKKLKLHTSPNG